MVWILLADVYRFGGCGSNLRSRSVCLHRHDFENVLLDREIDRK